MSLFLKSSFFGLLIPPLVIAAYVGYLSLKFGGPGEFDLGIFRRFATMFLGVAAGTICTSGMLLWAIDAIRKHFNAMTPQ
jgi:hypothetical protein